MEETISTNSEGDLSEPNIPEAAFESNGNGYHDDFGVGELGPPIDMDDPVEVAKYFTSEEQEVKSYSPHTGFFAEFRETPEYLNPNLPHIHRRRVRVVLQEIKGEPVLLSAKIAEKMKKPLFADEVDNNPVWMKDLLDNHVNTAEKFAPTVDEEDGTILWSAETKELGFLINNLPDKVRSELVGAYKRGERINFNFVEGTRWKVTRFGDQTVEYARPRSSSDDPKQYRGSNFVVFSRVEVGRNEDGEIVLHEKLLAEANLHTKIQSVTLHPRGGPREGLVMDRTLKGLARRAEEGDPYLLESEYLYNQSAHMYEGKLTKSDEQWIRNGLIDFLDGVVDRQGYAVKGTYSMQLKLDKSGSVITKGEDSVQEVRFAPLRLNVEKGGYLDGVIRRLGEQTHSLNRLLRHELFENDVYPVFQSSITQAIDLQKIEIEKEKIKQDGNYEVSPEQEKKMDPALLLAFQLTRTEAMEKRFFPKISSKRSYPKNLTYLLNLFNSDPVFDDWMPQGVERSVLVLEQIVEINKKRKSQKTKTAELLYREHVNDAYAELTLERLDEMTNPQWLSPEAHRALALPVSVDEDPILRVNQKRYRHSDPGKLFNGKFSPLKSPAGWAPENRDGLIAYDVHPSRVSVDEMREQLAEYGIDIIKHLVSEGDRPAIYGLFMDSNPREMSDGTQLSPAQWINMLRRAFDTFRYTNGRSSQHAIETGFKFTEELAKRRATSDPELTSILQYFNYESRVEATKESKSHSGIAGEVFTRMALNADLGVLLGRELSKEIDYKIIYVDRDRTRDKGKLSRWERDKMNKFLSEIDQAPHEDEKGKRKIENARPDFIVQLENTETSETAELWIDSKAYIKKVTPTAIQNLYDHYKRALNGHRTLVVVVHSPLERVEQSARIRARDLGVVLVDSEAVASALELEQERYENVYMGSVTEEYAKFYKHPSVYAEEGDKREGIAAYESTLDTSNYVSGALFAQDNEGGGREKLVYSEG